MNRDVELLLKQWRRRAGELSDLVAAGEQTIDAFDATIKCVDELEAALAAPSVVPPPEWVVWKELDALIARHLALHQNADTIPLAELVPLLRRAREERDGWLARFNLIPDILDRQKKGE